MIIEVIRSNRRTMGAEIKGEKLIIRVPLFATDKEIDRFIEQNKKWIETHLAKAMEREKAKESCHKLTQDEIVELADKAREVIPERVAHYAPLIGVTYGKITIRKQRSRWGSCSSKGNLNFNYLLMLAPKEVLDSVIVHELCHRREMNHSDRFYSLVLGVFPDYYKHHQWLKDNSAKLHKLASHL